MKHSASPGALELVEGALEKRLKETRKTAFSYAVPSLWTSSAGVPKSVAVNPFDFYLGIVRAIRNRTRPQRQPPTGGEWTKEAVIYNMFPRTTAAFDHDGSGKLDCPVNADGFRETGSFLKALAMLPYIERLGANTVHLLPVTSIGHDGNKGTLGSPYAIRNPYVLDENLSEPLLGLDVKTEFKAFVEAAHRLGLRVVVEFVFRTAAKDADWVKEHPDWFYWIKEEVPVREPHSADESRYGSPVFTREELDRIHHEVRDHRFENLVPPHQQYRDFFTDPPRPEDVVREGGRYVGRLANGQRVKVPGAFADWPPDDNQPPWGDVTYLRMYTHPDFNYIGYNTVRMYDARLAAPQHVNRPLWDKIIGIIPYYQSEFGIDGVMIDMGHALPVALKASMVRTARSIDPDFAFWDENFAITHRSREEGYNAVFGYLWTDQHHPARMRAFCHRSATEGFPIPFFATAENHNTPRAAARPGGTTYGKWCTVVNAFLPAVPFIHSGFELAERYPINTGLDFKTEELRKLPSEKLPLFSEYGYDWNRKEGFTTWVAAVLALRSEFMKLVVDERPQSFRQLHPGNEDILAFARVSDTSGERLAVVGSMNYTANEALALRLDTMKKQVVDLLAGRRLPVEDGHVKAALGPGECLVFEY